MDMLIIIRLITLGFVIVSGKILVEEVRNNRELVKLESLPNYPGLYFVPQFWFLMSSESWEVLYNVPLEPLARRINLTESIWKEIVVHKQNLTILWTNPKIELLESAIKNLQDAYHQFRNLLIHTDTITRNKRGIFNSLGRALKIITGTMDSDDEDYYNEKINTVALDNKRIYQLEKDQLTIIQSTLWGVNKTTSEIKGNQDLLTKAYQYLEELSKNNRENIINITLKYTRHTEILQQMSVVQQLVSETLDSLEVLYNAIDEARQGKISSYLIKPAELTNILRNVQGHLHVGDSLPLPVTIETIYRYYDIVRITVYFTSDSLRYIIRIPLKHISRKFHLFKVIPLPQPLMNITLVQTTYAIPEISTEYIGFSEDLQYYVTMKESQVQDCTGPPLIICNNVPVIYPVDEIEHSHARCEVEIFKNNSSPNCNFRFTKIINPNWERIPHSNTWIFSAMPDNEPVTITCKNNNGVMQFLRDIRLGTHGQLTLQPDCAAVGSSFTLLSRDKTRSETMSHPEYSLIIPNVNISFNDKEKEILKQFSNFSVNQRELIMNHVTHNLNDLNIASIRISKLREIMNQYEPTSFDVSSNHYHFIGMWTLIITLVCLYVSVKCGLCTCIKNCLAPKKNNTVLALQDISRSPEANANDPNTTTALMSEITESQQSPRRSSRLMKLRN